MSDNGKPKFGMYWASSCGGCEIAVLNIGDHILDVDAVFDVVFWPVAADFKYEDVRNYPDGYIDLCLFNGAIRNSENEEMAKLLRRKSKVLVAFGSCAYEGCIPALSNFTTKEATLQRRLPGQPVHRQPGRHPAAAGDQDSRRRDGNPRLLQTVKALDQVVDVDYYVPGCPPEPHQIWAVLAGGRGRVDRRRRAAGQGLRHRRRGDGRVRECPLEKNVEEHHTLLPALRDHARTGHLPAGAGHHVHGPGHAWRLRRALPAGGYGLPRLLRPAGRRGRPGRTMLTAVASVLEVGKTGDTDADLERKLDKVLDTLVDPAGTFYRFSMAHSILHRPRERWPTAASNGDNEGGES